MKRTIVYLIVIILIVLSAVYPHLMLNPGELTEGHQKIKNDCATCHKPFWGIESSRCISCHKLDEIGLNDTTANKFSFHGKLKNLECASCHSDHKGINPQMSISRFDHKLLSNGMQMNCNSCHDKPADKLHDQLSVSCNSCHNTDSWKISGAFNHDMIVGINKTNCISCHQKPSDSFHQSLQDNCSKCHATNKWTPSSFDHSSYFILDNNHNAKCATCHSNNNFSIYTCYGCHEHSENKIIEEHQEEGIYNFTNCVSCHRSGNEHDIKMNNKEKNLNSKSIKDIKDYIKTHKKEDEKDDD
jgi:hypothetical protein